MINSNELFESAFDLDGGDVEVLHQVDPKEVDDVIGLAGLNGVNVRRIPTAGIEPISATTIVLVGITAAVRNVLRALDFRRGGQVIDLRKSAARPFYRTVDLSYGTLVVVTRSGKVIIDVKDVSQFHSTDFENIAEEAILLQNASGRSVLRRLKKKIDNSAAIRLEKE